MSGEFVLGRPPQTDDELYWLIQAMWGVRIPRVQVCPDHVAPFTAFADAYFGRNSIEPDSPVDSISLWHGSRGLSGKSFMLSILGLTKTLVIVLIPVAGITVAGHLLAILTSSRLRP